VSSLQQDMEVLRRVPLFDSVDTANLRLLAFTSKRLMFEDKQVLFRQGEDGDAAYVVINGVAEVVLGTGEQEIVLAALGRHEIVGEIAILCDLPRTATVRARGTLDALMISKPQLLDMLRHAPDMAVAIIRVLALRLARANTELASTREALKRAGG
jgi:CRP/FNR family cyclic AMP-dependent transcriptional regulator